MESRYDVNEVEERTYRTWEESGLFNPDVCIKKGVTAKDAETFSIVLPPPNVTGELHMGHAAMLVIEDILARFARMSGKRTLWLPGTDHAAIATQVRVEKELYKKEHKTRHDLGRKEFLKRVNDYAQASRETIIKQIKRMGASLDWSREVYTLDEERSIAVTTAFKKMYELGLVYRGYRVVNWDPKGQTVISDEELVYEERKAKLYTFKYDKNFPIAISTTRPETKLGDTAVAVHPHDERYKKFVGKEYDVVFCGQPLHLKIIADETVDKDFGTGALGVTPAHSMTDWELAQKHGLPLVPVIDEHGRMTVEGELQGKKTAEAREIIVTTLKAQGLMEKEEEVAQNISTAQRTGAVVEPLPKLQWFVAVNKKFKNKHGEKTLKELMRLAIEKEGIEIIPERFQKIYMNWIENLRDWCISRQIWFGHRIPVWYRGDEIHVGSETPRGEGFEQDPDTLDTWFSSGLWPFSTLGWPEKTSDLKNYFPNSVLETGYDILFFWVARMILMSTVLMGEIPFRKVYLHGLVRDEKGRKMSKSLGNGIDPLEMANKYGADATRLSLVIGAAAGNDIKLSESRIKGYRNFSTKIWNAARFVLMNKPDEDGDPEWSPEQAADLKEFAEVKKEITAHIDNFELHLAAEKAYHYFWHTFADVLIEREKEKLRGGDIKEKNRSYRFLKTVLNDSLKLLHPFMPFVTEEIWKELGNKGLLMVEKW